MRMLGYEKEDLNTKKRKDHFRETTDPNGSPQSPDKNKEAIVKSLNTIESEEVDDAIVTLRYKHY